MLGTAWVLELLTVSLVLACCGCAAIVAHAVAPTLEVVEGLSPAANSILVGLIAVGLISFIAFLVVRSSWHAIVATLGPTAQADAPEYPSRAPLISAHHPLFTLFFH